MKKKYLMKIQLQSDLCVSDGGVYNSMLDTEVCYDRYGFPYIPAKRIKGCLREAALELNDWGEEINIEHLFGVGECQNKASVTIENAFLEDYEKLRETVMKYPKSLLLHPQNILNHYSYIRYQTSVDYETGVSAEGSLRSMRVLNKGLIFEAKVIMEQDDFEQLNMCCRIFKHMGIARTRGLGEVNVTLKQDNDKCDNEQQKEGLGQEYNYLEYEITLEAPVVCNTIRRGQAETMDYIEGGKVLGLLAESLRENEISYEEFLRSEGKIICSNAYIQHNGCRYVEAPGYLYQIKNDSDVYVNKLYETEKAKEEVKNRQLNQMKHCYVNLTENGLVRSDVDVEVRYHHRRSEDKSVGRAKKTEENQADFYQIASICEGQSFKGFLFGDSKKIKKAYDVLKQKSVRYLGAGKTSEYGKITFKITNQKYLPVCDNGVVEKMERIFVKQVAVTLISPTIVYNDRAMASVEQEELVAEMNTVLQELGMKGGITDKYYLKYCEVGGYNVTWNRRKPTIMAFDKGSTILFSFSEGVEVDSEMVIPLFIGERNMEGYGEIRIMPIMEQGTYKGKMSEFIEVEKTGNISVSQENGLITGLCNDLFKEFIKYHAADTVKKNNDEDEEQKPIVRNMLLLCKEHDNIKDVEKEIQERYEKNTEKKEKKLEMANDILKTAKEGYGQAFNSFLGQYCIEEYQPDEKMEKEYLKNYLIHLKYLLRMQDNASDTKMGTGKESEE